MEYKNYKDYIKNILNKNKITEKQITFINKYIQDSEVILNITNKNNINELIYSDVKKIFTYIYKTNKISQLQLSIIKKYPLEQITKFLKKTIKNYKDISIYDFNKFINKNPNSNFKNSIKNCNLKRDCKILEWDDYYEYGIQTISKSFEMKYIKSYDILCIDYDSNNLENLLKYLNRCIKILAYDSLTPLFRIYKTFSGYHIFIVSQIIPYNSDLAIKIGHILHSDKWYMLFSYKHGYCIRLTPKQNRNELYTHKYLGDYGFGKYNEIAIKFITKFDNKLNDLSSNYISNKTVFYQSFIDNVTNNEEQIEPIYLEKYFDNYLFETKGISFDTIKEASYKYLINLRKPQRCISSHNNYYIAVDMLTNIYYLCMKDIMMIDIDFYKNNHFKDQMDVIEFCNKIHTEKSLNFSIFKSNNGIHIFITNKLFNYKDKESIDLMIEMKCDIKYIIFAYIRGWCVRINPKKNDTYKNYIHIKDIGEANKENKYLIDLHLKLYDNFSNYVSYF